MELNEMERMKLWIGKRVTLLPHLDRWMMGDRHGEIVGVGRAIAGKPCAFKVKLDVSGKTMKFLERDLEMH